MEESVEFFDANGELSSNVLMLMVNLLPNKNLPQRKIHES